MMHIKADNYKHALQVLGNCWVLLLHHHNFYCYTAIHLHLYAFSFFLPSNSLFSNYIFLSTCPFSPFFQLYFYGLTDGPVAQKMLSIAVIFYFIILS